MDVAKQFATLDIKKFTIPENKSVITDSALGLTISTDK
jgi:hypothetical protein